MGDALLVTAGLFSVVAGTNDGTSVLSASIRVPGLRPVVSLAILLSAMVVGPCLLFGTGVASTLAHQLVPFSGPGADPVLLTATLSAMLVVFGLARLGVPTSLTLALVGAIAGAALGAGLPVHTGELVKILLLGVAAPVVSAALALVVAPVSLRAAAGAGTSRRLQRWHGTAFCLQCLAYSANGGQKMLAIFAIAAGAASGHLVLAPWWLALLVALLFGVGVLTGIRRISGRLGRDILAVHLRHAAVAETCSAAVVLGASLVGVPLTMSQSFTGALVGAGASQSLSRVRWPAVTRMAGAWCATLPAAVAVACLSGLLIRGV